MAEQPPAMVQAAPPPISLIDMVRLLSGRQDAKIRYLTPKQAKRMNVPNAMVDAIPTKGGKLRPSRYMFMPQGTYQALESLTRDTGVTWPEETQALALMTLIHEAGHMRGGKQWQNERRQQAFALDKYLAMAKRLGIDKERRRRMFETALEYTRSLPRDYHTRHVRP